MKIIEGLGKLQLNKPSVVCFGKFDGFHLGHAALVSEAAEIAKKEKRSIIVIAIDTGRRPIISEACRDTLFEEAGADVLVRCRLDDIKAIKAQTFATEYLAQRANASYVVVGPDVCFGSGREGNAELLFDLGLRCGFYTIVVPKKKYQGRPISSSRIRDCIAEGDTESAVAMLGHGIS